MAYDALVFDNDGVLTTPTRRSALERAIRDAFDAVGVSSVPRDHLETLVRPDVPSLRSVAAEHGVDATRLWAARERAAIDVQLSEMRAGRKRLYDDVADLRELSIPRAIVSNNQHETIENVVTQFDLDGFVPWIGREPTLVGIRRKKPTPYYLERALSTLDATNPLYVGDSEVDVLTADACGVDSAFVRRPHRVEYELTVEPSYEIESLTELARLVEG